MCWAKRDQYDRRGTMSCGTNGFASWGRGWKPDLEGPVEFPQVEMWEVERKRIFSAEEIAPGKTWSQGIRARSRNEEQSWVEQVLQWNMVRG